MEKGMDCTAGGCKYNGYGGTATGLATLGDSLSPSSTCASTRSFSRPVSSTTPGTANWEGYEPLRQQILNNVPHYGNADPYADDELKWVVDSRLRHLRECYSVRAKKYGSGLYGASEPYRPGLDHVCHADGRRTGKPLADAMSPAQSRDTGGQRRLRESCCFDHHHFSGGIALNLRMHPSVLSREEGIAKLRDMTKAYSNPGAVWRSSTTWWTRQRSGQPRQAYGIPGPGVRIAGYSAYFRGAGRELQNDIIARNENRI